MNDHSNRNLSEALRDVVGDNDETTPDEDKQRNQRLSIMRRLLRSNRSALLDKHPDDLALDTIEFLAKIVRRGHAEPEILTMLADFLVSVVDRSQMSPTAREEEVKLAHRILGHKPNGRPNKDLAAHRAIDMFALHRAHGSSVEDAERAALDAYQSASRKPDRTYESTRSRKVRVTRGASEIVVSEAERLLESSIRPKLRAAGLLPRKAKGRKRRPKISGNKPSP